MSITTWLAHFEYEDALLFIWLVIVTPLLEIILGGALRGLSVGNLDARLPNATWLGVLFVLSGILAVACALTRAPVDGDDKEWNASSVFGYAHLPMLAATGIILALGFNLLGIENLSEAAPCGIFAIFIVGLTAYRWMPLLNFTIRRVLMAPFILVTTTLFANSISPMLGGIEPSALFKILQNETGRFEFGLLLAGTLVFYLMFVFAPRVIAGSIGLWWQWALRFGLYIVGLILNIGLLQAV